MAIKTTQALIIQVEPILAEAIVLTPLMPVALITLSLMPQTTLEITVRQTVQLVR